MVLMHVSVLIIKIACDETLWRQIIEFSNKNIYKVLYSEQFVTHFCMSDF